MLKVQAMLQVKNPEGRRFHPYKEGEHVWIEGTNLKTLYPSAKLGPKWYGPFKVLKQFSNAVVTIPTGKTPDSAVMTTRAGKYH
jgi:hypothetical protein